MPEVKDVIEQVDKLSAELTESLEDMKSEMDATGETTRETADKIAMLTEDLVGAKAGLDEIQKKHADEVGSLQGRVDDLEAKLQRGKLPAEIAEELKSPGQLFTESEPYREVIEHDLKSSRPVKFKSFWPTKSFGNLSPIFADQKAAFLSSQVAELVMPEWPAMVTPALRQLRMRDLIPVRNTSSNSVKYLREVGFNPNATVAVTTLAVASGVATVTASAHGGRRGERVRIAGVTGTDATILNGDHWITSVADANTYTFATSAGDTAGASGTITSLMMQRHGAAAAVAEGGTKPEATLFVEQISAPIETIAHYVQASRQSLEDSSQLRSHIDDRLRYGVLYKEDVDLLYGTGTSPQVAGIMTALGVQNWLWSEGVTGDTKIDAVRKGMTLGHISEYMPTGLVCNPTDWQDIQLQKGTDAHYVWISVSQGGAQMFFMLPVVVTNAINAGEALVGAFQNASTIWDRQQASVRMSESHGTTFVENVITLLGEERLCQTIYRPDAFVKVTFDSAPA